MRQALVNNLTGNRGKMERILKWLAGVILAAALYQGFVWFWGCDPKAQGGCNAGMATEENLGRRIFKSGRGNE
jgi:hypothetical protein